MASKCDGKRKRGLVFDESDDEDFIREYPDQSSDDDFNPESEDELRKEDQDESSKGDIHETKRRWHRYRWNEKQIAVILKNLPNLYRGSPEARAHYREVLEICNKLRWPAVQPATELQFKRKITDLRKWPVEKRTTALSSLPGAASDQARKITGPEKAAPATPAEPPTPAVFVTSSASGSIPNSGCCSPQTLNPNLGQGRTQLETRLEEALSEVDRMRNVTVALLDTKRTLQDKLGSLTHSNTVQAKTILEMKQLLKDETGRSRSANVLEEGHVGNDMALRKKVSQVLIDFHSDESVVKDLKGKIMDILLQG